MAIIWLLPISFLQAQINENFSDGDFSGNPVWTGTDSHFRVNSSFQLQLFNEGNSATSWLQTPNSLVDSTSWEFYIKLSFSPSDNNNARVYLVSDQSDLSGPLNGYFLQFGEALSSDAIELFKQTGTQTTSICRGEEGAIASSFNAFIKVVHRTNGQWIVYSDFNSTGQYSVQCQGFDNEIQTTEHFGFYCKYTSSNSTNFYFDQIIISNYQVDVEAPEVENILVDGENSLNIQFSEVLTAESAQNTANYIANSGIGNPQSAQLSGNGNEVTLNFASSFQENQNYELSIENIADLNGNVMRDTTVSFARVEIGSFDVVFNEIMADPTPVVALPEVEYLELFNRTASAISLAGWQLIVDETVKDFPDVIIAPNSWLILCKESNIPLLSSFGPCAGFSSFSITNTGQSLKLVSAEGLEIHSISFTDNWYADSEKDDGGWSIEQINPSDFCSGAMNWKASQNDSGGTPGSVNSVFNNSLATPFVQSIQLVDNPLLLVEYSQQMNLEHILNRSNYSVSPGSFTIQQIIVKDSSSSVYLIFDNPFELGITYELTVMGAIENCAGQLMQVPQSLEFMVPKSAVPGDVVINEIMADPEPTQGLPPYEYLELYNNAEAPIFLTDWQLIVGSTAKTFENISIMPHSWLVLCSDEAASFFDPSIITYRFSRFSLTNEEGDLILKDFAGGIIHQVAYGLEWYDDDSKTDGGWSLEAINPADYCLEKTNWGASIDSRGGTPGTLNSIDGTSVGAESPAISRIEILGEQLIRVYFNTKADSSSLSVASNYSIDNGIGQPLNCIIEGPKYKSVQLMLENPLQKGIVYVLETQNTLIQCNGESMGSLSKPFAIPDEIEKGDLVFNEILADPAVDDGEYIEIVNISDKILETSGLSISSLTVNQYDTSWSTAVLTGALLFPGDYVAFTPSAIQVLKVYHSENPENIITLEDFPSLPNSYGMLALHKSAYKFLFIDYLVYNEDMHYSLLKDTKGVSLEKIHLQGGNDASNWHSAASAVNYGTPGYRNSQNLTEGVAESAFELTPLVFSPDNDGFDDVLQINYKMNDAGYQLNVKIYDSRGREVKHLIENELLGAEGSLVWDGQNTDNEKVPMGIYILLFEYFDLQGDVKTEKLTTVVGGKL